jgi:hypothetical protein
MRMVHYYLALAFVLAPCLLATLLSGAFQDGSERHLLVSFFTAVLCVATQTILILFMIVSGRVLKAAMKSRRLEPRFLAELNEFFARRRAYPLAIFAAFAATVAAVLGYGRFIGVPPAVHMLVGLVAVLLNLFALGAGTRTLRQHQDLMDRAAAELDRLDRIGAPIDEAATAIPWVYPARTRWLVFAVSAWAPYLYWALIEWRGEFARVAWPVPLVTAVISGFGFTRALRAGAREDSG